MYSFHPAAAEKKSSNTNCRNTLNGSGVVVGRILLPALVSAGQRSALLPVVAKNKKLPYRKMSLMRRNRRWSCSGKDKKWRFIVGNGVEQGYYL